MQKKSSKDLKTFKKHAGGRPTKYKPEYCKALVDFFDVEINIFKDVSSTNKDGSTKEWTEEEASPLPTFLKFAKSISVSYDILLDWEKKYIQFHHAYNTAKELQKHFIIENTLRNNYQGYFAGLMMKNMHGWRDKTELESTVNHKVSMPMIEINGIPLDLGVGE
jgi:hypothetical protein